MMHALRPSGALASGLINFAMLVLFQAGFPDYAPCCSHSPAAFNLFPAWQPYVDNPGIDPFTADGGRCPRPRAHGNLAELTKAPLPTGYDPVQANPLFACVRLGTSGDVLAATLLGTTGRPGLDPALLATIRSAWRFEPPIPRPRRPLWHRVRLSSS